MFAVSSATVAVKVFSFEEAQIENNLSKPRILIKNVGTEAINNIEYRYYFTETGTETPLIDDYWTPEETAFLVFQGNGHYYLNYVVSGTLAVGKSFPENSGCVVGIHFNSWEPWDKSDDYSNNYKTTLTENTKIVVYVNGVLVYGTPPNYGVSDPPPMEFNQLSSFALYSTNGTKVIKNSVFSGGGALGSNSNVEVGQNSTVYGNLITGSSAIVRAGASVNGTIYAKQDVSIYNGAVVNGALYQNAPVATITIPERTITVGTTDKTIASNTTVTLTPGSYRYCYVNSNAKLILVPGVYKFDKFYMLADSKMEFSAATNQSIEVEVKNELEFNDRSQTKFQSHGYAPVVKFYTNDANTIRIGVNAKITGLIYAPKANLSMSAGSQCDGAIYAKQITVEDGAGVASNDVNPSYDQDNDGVPNQLEILTNTNPEDSLSFKMMAIPDKVNLDNTVDQAVTYNLAQFAPEYSDENKAIFNIPAGTLIPGKLNALWKVSNSAIDFNNNPLSSYFLPNGYSVESRFFSFEPGTFKSNAFIDVELPVIDNSVADKRYSIYYLTEGASSWCMANAVTKTDNGVITVSGTVKSPLVMVIVAKRDVTTAYLDGSVFVDDLPQAQVSISLTIENVSAATTGTVVIEYIDKANQSVTVPKTISMVNTSGLDNTRRLTGIPDYNLIRSAQQIEIKKIQITTSAGLSYTWSGSYTVDPGIEVTLRSSCPAHYYTAAQSPIAFESASNFALESIDLDGEGRARYSLDGSGFTYDYYITDHLGSTREIVNSTGDVTEATMYYPYGTMDYLKPASSTDNAREKFTGKELDAGENPTGEATFDIRITNFDAGSMHYRGELWVNYIDASTTREMLKIYSMFYNPVDRSFTLNTTERFPTEVWITRLQIFTSGAPTPIAYDKTTYNYRILTDHGLTVKLDTDGANLINNPATNYFETTPYTPVRVAGSNLFYFGARYYDPENGYWISTDPLEQFCSGYGYTGNGVNPIVFVDPDGLFNWYAVLASSIVGGVTGIIQGYRVGEVAGAEGWDMFGYIAAGNAIGSTVGFACGVAFQGIDNGVSSWLANTAISEGIAAGISGAVAGAASGAIGGAANAWAFGGADQGQFFAGTPNQIGNAAAGGALIGGVIGGASGYLSVNPSKVEVDIPKAIGDLTSSSVKSVAKDISASEVSQNALVDASGKLAKNGAEKIFNNLGWTTKIRPFLWDWVPQTSNILAQQNSPLISTTSMIYYQAKGKSFSSNQWFNVGTAKVKFPWALADYYGYTQDDGWGAGYTYKRRF
jgi:RHS repeat-associated protein